MALISTDARAVFAKGKALFVIARHHGLQLRQAHAAASARQAGQQFIRLHPACAIELEANGLRTVAQHQAEEFALCDDDVVYSFSDSFIVISSNGRAQAMLGAAGT